MLEKETELISRRSILHDVRPGYVEKFMLHGVRS